MGIIFSTEDIRGRLDDSLTIEYAWNIGKAFSESLPEQGTISLVQSETANQSLVRAVVEGMLLQGRNVIDAGTGDVSNVAEALQTGSSLGAVYISHDDAQNIEIIALFDETSATITADGGLDEIKTQAESGNFLPAAEKGTITSHV